MRATPAAVEDLLRGLFPQGVAVSAEAIVPANADTLWQEERPAVTGAVPSRLAEFVAGRTAARRVLASLGLPMQALPPAPDRSVTWPEGIAGSLAHAAGFAVAVGRAGAPLGIDIEDDSPIAADLWPLLCRPAELARLDPVRIGVGVKRIHCAKEAVFKAQGRDRAMFGHETLDVTLAETSFDAQFLTHVGAFGAGQIVRGRIVTAMGLVLAGVAV